MDNCVCNVSGYAVKDAEARRRVTIIEEELEGYVKPEGILTITTNGVHPVAEYEAVNVKVPGSSIPEGYIKPSGTYTISDLTQNGMKINVSQYEYVYLKIATFDGEGEV